MKAHVWDLLDSIFSIIKIYMFILYLMCVGVSLASIICAAFEYSARRGRKSASGPLGLGL